ncbi:hypothetical protein, partial [Amycolatopsis sp. H20-H5]|uniref:hypothetical protein n=1 Tax=Amycolatopsis sp. H20-H5 TaxID=3046309 RepID=UPI002DB6CBA7
GRHPRRTPLRTPGHLTPRPVTPPGELHWRGSRGPQDLFHADEASAGPGTRVPGGEEGTGQ